MSCGSNNLRAFECSIRAILRERAERFSGEVDDHGLIKFWYVDSFPLEIRLTTHLAARVKLCRARAIAVASPHLGLFSGYFALLCHILK